MAYCRSCGAAADAVRDYCTRCGARAETTTATAGTGAPSRVEVEPTLHSGPTSSLPQRHPEESVADGIDDDSAAWTGRARRPALRRVTWFAMFLAVGIGWGLLAARYLDQRAASAQADAEADFTATTLSTVDPTVQSTSSTESPSTESPSDSSAVHDQTSQLNALLAQSGAARGSVVDAVAAVSSCADVSAGANALAAAANSRQDALDQLESLDTEALPHGAQLMSTLRTALQKSLEADQHFAAWAQSVQRGGCDGSAPHDSQYQAGTQASREATAAKHHFVQLWNPIATSEGLPRLEEKDI
jgi:hypothetical protein